MWSFQPLQYSIGLTTIAEFPTDALFTPTHKKLQDHNVQKSNFSHAKGKA